MNSLEVTHYEVQRWANPWTPLADNVTGTVYLDWEGAAQRGLPGAGGERGGRAGAVVDNRPPAGGAA